MAETLELIQTDSTSTDDSGLGHWYCPDCQPAGDFAFCGTDIRDYPELGNEYDTDCIVCIGLDYCPKCDGL